MVFRLADLVSLYQQRLQQLGVKDHNVNSTRLKDKLLGEIPDLEAYKKGRDVLWPLKKMLVQFYRRQSTTPKLSL